jgi:hypothetical protein
MIHEMSLFSGRREGLKPSSSTGKGIKGNTGFWISVIFLAGVSSVGAFLMLN